MPVPQTTTGQRSSAGSLRLIIGPPNSGKAGVVVRHLIAVADDEPVLVVPTADDVDRFDRELALRPDLDVALGITVTTFYGLIDHLVARLDVQVPPRAGETVKLALARRAAREVQLRQPTRSVETPGFAPALVEAIDELRSAWIDPETAKANVEQAGGDWKALDIADLYARFDTLMRESGYGDLHGEIETLVGALRRDASGWQARPVFFYGFDNFPREQLELVSALARNCDVLVTANWEDREASRARASFVSDLVDDYGAVRTEVEDEPPAAPGHAFAPTNPTLDFVARNFLESGVGAAPSADGIELLVADGGRAQAELVGATVAKLLADGVEPGTIEVVLRNPDADGPFWERVLRRYDIPVAALARLDVARTASGAAAVALVKLLGRSAGPEDLLRWLRLGVPAARAGEIDRIELQLRRSHNTPRGAKLRDLAGDMVPAMPDAGPVVQLRHLAGLVRELEVIHGHDPIEIRSAGTCAAAIDELAGMYESGILDRGVTRPLDEAAAALARLEVPMWTGSAEGRVRITSPQRLRANRGDHLIVCSLHDGEFPRHDRPRRSLIGEDDREPFGLPRPVEPSEEDAYLFATCLYHPRKRLYLSWQSANSDGTERIRSRFIDDVAELIPGGLDALPEHRRTLADVVFEPVAAPRRREILRAIAARTDTLPPGLDVAEREKVQAARVAAEFEPATQIEGHAAEQMAVRADFSVTELEHFIRCPWCWFVDRVVKPTPFRPDADQMATGNLVHSLLERLYREKPGDFDSIPRTRTLSQWQHRAEQLLEPIAEELQLAGPGPQLAAIRSRALALVQVWLEYEARLDTDLRPETVLLEASFGTGPDSPPALELDPESLPGVTVRGKIDRVDKIPGDGAVVIRDYKTRSEAEKIRDIANTGIIQPFIYALAISELWGREVAGAALVPLGGINSNGQRGAARAEYKAAMAGFGLPDGDFLDEVEWETVLEEAQAMAVRAVELIRAGRLDTEADELGVGGVCGYGTVCGRDRKWVPAEGGEERPVTGGGGAD